MKAAVYFGHRDIRVMDVPEPKPDSGEVKIKVAWAGICGTDRHEYTGPVFIPTDKPHRLTGRTAPLIMGHEFTGIITEVGEGVTKWKIGDRVTASGSLVCYECKWCKEGRRNICEKLGFNGISKDGAFAEFVIVNERELFKIPDNVSLKDAVLAEPLACGVHSTKLIGNVAGKKVVIVGPGIIGLACLIAAKNSGAKDILVIGVGTSKEVLIRKIGADYVDSRKQDPIEYVKEWSKGNMADIVYECVGLEQTLDTALRSSRIGGKIMVMGVFEKDPKFCMNFFQEGERTLLSSQAYVDEIGDVLIYMSEGKIPTKDLVTKEITLDKIVEEGFEELLKNSAEQIKVIVKIDNLE